VQEKGDGRFFEIRAFPLRDADGAVTSAIETIANVTERYLLEKEQVKTQKIEAVGTLAGGIAHDFNNLLQGVFGYLSLAKASIDKRDRALRMLEQAEKALELSVGLTSQLLTFSKGGKPVMKCVDLRGLIETAAALALSGSRCDHRCVFDADLYHVMADAGQLSQVIQNIVINAKEAMSGSGSIEITVENVRLLPGESPPRPEGGRFVRISIRDEGVGIPEETLPRIFDPYFTTKEHGNGLGLATSYSIVRNHGGTLTVSSKTGQGSTFVVLLPAGDGVVAETRLTPAPDGRRGRILVMDDEEMVRDIASEMIRMLGHEVVCVENGARAVETFVESRESGRPFDVVILDLTVKGGEGGEGAVRRLRDIDPSVRAVVSSGYANNQVMSDYRAHGFSAFLSKPYRIEALRDCLNRLLERPQPDGETTG
jgi:signal transduction histidine kinase/CheY-like chemotaxis protein